MPIVPIEHDRRVGYSVKKGCFFYSGVIDNDGAGQFALGVQRQII